MTCTLEPSKSGEHSTPYSKNVSAHSQAITSATIDDIDTYVNDMKNNHTVPFDKFLLGLGSDGKSIQDKNDGFITGLSGDRLTSLKIKEYGEKRKETDLYGPFCELANYIISKRDNEKIVFSRNGTNYIGGPRGNSRKPDVVALDKDNASVANGKWKDFNTSGPTDVKWIWSDFRFISDFKYSRSTKLNAPETIVESELGRGAESTSKSKTKSDVSVPKSSHGRKETGNRFLSDKLGNLLGEGSSRKRMLGKEYKPHNRIWHCLVYEFFIPLYKMTEISDFKQAVRDIVLGHHLLATSCTRILHQDISIRNLMVRVRNGVIRGVLNDWDLAEMEPRSNDDHSGERTGTRPFMAIDLLVPQPPRHLERFDWESFFYVIFMIACRYDRGEDINPDALSRWYNPDDVTLRALKKDLSIYGTGIEGATDFYRQVVFDWIKPLRMLFARGYIAHIPPEDHPFTPSTGEVLFDNETLGGHVTWEKFWEILQK